MEVAENYRIDANFRWLGSEIKANEELCPDGVWDRAVYAG